MRIGVQMNNLIFTSELTLLSASDVAEILKISRAMAYKLMRTREIPTVQIGKSKRVRLSDLKVFIQDNLVSE